MAEVSLDDVRHVAKLAHMALSENELVRVQRELNRIMDHFAELQRLDTDDVPEMSHSIPMVNVYRDDVVGQALPADKAVQNAPDSVDNFFRVPAFMEDEGA